MQTISFRVRISVPTGLLRQQTFRRLNRFEAYSENYRYPNTSTYFLRKQDAGTLLTVLNDKPGVDAAGYREGWPARSVPVLLCNLPCIPVAFLVPEPVLPFHRLLRLRRPGCCDGKGR